jgi:hypothetical protein
LAENIVSKYLFSSRGYVRPICLEKYGAKSVYHLQQPAITAKVGMQFCRESGLEFPPYTLLPRRLMSSEIGGKSKDHEEA